MFTDQNSKGLEIKGKFNLLLIIKQYKKMRYSIVTKDRVSVKDYGFPSFANNTGRNLISIYATGGVKTAVEKVIQKAPETTSDIMGNKNLQILLQVNQKIQ